MRSASAFCTVRIQTLADTGLSVFRLLSGSAFHLHDSLNGEVDFGHDIFDLELSDQTATYWLIVIAAADQIHMYVGWQKQ